MTPDPAKVCLGVVVGSKGLRGEVKIKSHTDDPRDVAAYGPVFTDDHRELDIAITAAGKGVVIGKIEGVDTREDAEALRGLNLYVERSALPPPDADLHYQADLIGLQAIRADGGIVGTVLTFHNFGAGDVMEVEKEGGDTILIPFTEAAIAEVDMKGQRVMITPLPGLFDDGDGSESGEVN